MYDTLISIIAFLAMITVVVFVHEYGHYIVGRLCGVKADVFSLGFGKKLFSRKDKNGCDWRVSALPLGGYVKFAGDMNAASGTVSPEHENATPEERKAFFQNKTLWQKALIVVAGPAFNIVFSWLIFLYLAFSLGSPLMRSEISGFAPGESAAMRSGLVVGDEFLSINGSKVASSEDVRRQVASSGGHPLRAEVLRKHEKLIFNIKPDMIVTETGVKIPMIGVYFAKPLPLDPVKGRLLPSIDKATEQTLFIAGATFDFFGKLVIGQASTDSLSGPLRIGQMAGEAAQTGALSFLQLTALISLSIGLINLLPIPMLDGGHLALYGLQALTRKEPTLKFKELIFKIGFVTVIALMGIAMLNDINSFLGS